MTRWTRTTAEGPLSGARASQPGNSQAELKTHNVNKDIEGLVTKDLGVDDQHVRAVLVPSLNIAKAVTGAGGNAGDRGVICQVRDKAPGGDGLRNGLSRARVKAKGPASGVAQLVAGAGVIQAGCDCVDPAAQD